MHEQPTATHPLHPPAGTRTGEAIEKHANAAMRFLWENGLSIVLLFLFSLSLIGQIWAGLLDYNNEQRSHGQPGVTLVHYLAGAHFWEAFSENWESEFLQMGAFVILTVFLRQKGSPESKPLEGDDALDADPEEKSTDPRAPWPVRRGGWVLGVYKHSLSLAFLLLFLISFSVHAWSGAHEFNQDQQQHGERALSVAQYLVTSRFWFESFQNWQSEFISILAMVVLSIWLREHGSAESKPVAAPHDENE